MGRRNQTAKTTQKYLERKLEREWRTAVYARLSTENNGLEDERSLANQVRYVEDYIRKFPNMKLTDRYVDNGYSGTNFNRPQFTRLMEDVKSGIIDCIVVKDLSRFGRNFIETGYYLEEIFPNLNVRIIAINDNYDSFDSAKNNALSVPIKNLVNEIYTRDITKKLMSTLRTQEKKGNMIYGLPPYGYIKDEKNPCRMKIDEEVEPYIRQIFSWAVHGVRVNEITNRLNAANVPSPLARRESLGCAYTKKGKKEKLWYPGSLKRLLENPVYMGDMVYLGQGGSGKKLTKSNTPKSQWRVIPNTHEPLVSREDFEKIQRILENVCKEQKSHLEKRKAQREALPDILQGKFFCLDCGHVMVYNRHFRKGVSNFRDYCCSGYLSDKEAKGMDNIPECRKEKYSLEERLCRTLVFDQIQLQIRAGLNLEKLAKQQAAIDENKRKELAEAVRLKEIEVKNISAKIQKLYEDYREKIIDCDDFIFIRQGYAEKQEIKKSELEALQKQLDLAEGKCMDTEWNELKSRLSEIAEKQAKTNNNEDDCVEIIEEDELPLIPGTDRLTKELVDEMIERIEYGSDKVLHITFKHKDWAAELAEKLNTTESEEMK